MKAAQAANGALRRVPVWPVYLVGLAPPFWLFWLGVTGGLGVEPVEALEHRLGELSLQLLIAALAITPLRRFTGISLIRFRRAIGLIAFYHVVWHLGVWLFLDVQIASEIWKDIVKRPYITIGMAGFALMLPLALTSNAWSVRKLGAARWRRLHQLTYGAAVLGAVHYVMLAKGFQLEPLLYLAAILALLAARIRPSRRAAAA